MQPTLTLVSALAVAAAMSVPAAAQQQPGPGETMPGFGVLPEAGLEPAPADQAQAEDDAPEPAEEEVVEEAPEAASPDEEEEEAPAALDPLAETGPEAAETLRETHGEWEVHCDPNRPDDCVMGQIGEDEEGNPVVEVQLVRLPQGAEAAALLTVVSPLGTLLPAGLGLQIDGGQVQRHPFIYCGPRGCVTELGLNQQIVTQMQRGRVARLLVTAIAAPEDPVEIDLSLIGFTAAYNAIPPAE